MSIEGQGHFFTIYIPGFVCFMLYKAKISGERKNLHDHWSSGSLCYVYLRLWLFPILTLVLITQRAKRQDNDQSVGML